MDEGQEPDLMRRPSKDEGRRPRLHQREGVLVDERIHRRLAGHPAGGQRSERGVRCRPVGESAGDERCWPKFRA